MVSGGGGFTHVQTLGVGPEEAIHLKQTYTFFDIAKIYGRICNSSYSQLAELAQLATLSTISILSSVE